MRTAFSFLILVLLALFSCGKSSNGGRRVGVDASWYPLEFGIRNNNVTAFSTELLTEIGRIEKIPFVKLTVNWNDLMEGLQKDKYEAILSSMPPYIFNMQLFDFSDVYLPLGPVLVTPVDSKINSLDQLNGKEIAVISGSTSALILEKSSGVLIRYYDSIPKALNDIVIGTVDGAIIDILSAVAFCNDLYRGILKVATPPLNDDGLRLITKHKGAPDLIKGFNAGLAQMKKNGSYAKLLDKWGLQESTYPSKGD
jgi:polar amino acid transport system substrate-binding protein